MLQVPSLIGMKDEASSLGESTLFRLSSVPFTVEEPWSLSCEGRTASQHSRGKFHQCSRYQSVLLASSNLLNIQSSIYNIPTVNSTANNSILWLLFCCSVGHGVAQSSGSESYTEVTSLTSYFIYSAFVYNTDYVPDILWSMFLLYSLI